MKKLLLATVAVFGFAGAAAAADLPSRYAPPPVVAAVPLFTWTGFYVGVNAGYGWNTNDSNTFFDPVLRRRQRWRQRRRLRRRRPDRLQLPDRPVRPRSRDGHPVRRHRRRHAATSVRVSPVTTATATGSAPCALAPVSPSTAPSSTPPAVSLTAISAAAGRFHRSGRNRYSRQRQRHQHRLGRSALVWNTRSPTT